MGKSKIYYRLPVELYAFQVQLSDASFRKLSVDIAQELKILATKNGSPLI